MYFSKCLSIGPSKGLSMYDNFNTRLSDLSHYVSDARRTWL